ncbi:MAG: hypothetical protein DRQ42_04870 [Gammaproteobacteria bacterium]|nr:MAG: hypothetical protein DRQ58_09025 [Gammaproteobacteria bacterium]RLA00707.1 MAG: hypothetical protein DRQ42_04870 [Gammaproteobacteria bacterium]
MSGKILALAREDSRKYITKGGFESDITIKTADGSLTVSLTGFATKHHISFDTDGTLINAKNAHICISEIELNKLSFPVRVDEEVMLLNCIVTFADSSSVIKTYIVRENYPNETLGLIVCILGDYNAS